MAALTRQQILAAKTRKVHVINVPELGGELRFRTVSASKALELEDVEDASSRERLLLVLQNTLVDENDQLMFPDKEGAEAFLDTITVEALRVIAETMQAAAKGTSSGNSEASQSGA